VGVKVVQVEQAAREAGARRKDGARRRRGDRDPAHRDTHPEQGIKLVIRFMLGYSIGKSVPLPFTFALSPSSVLLPLPYAFPL
jgi:hypothetical protein